jgi:outer membrane protein TolC
MKFQQVALLFITILPISHAQVLKITEKALINRVTDNIPRMQEIESVFLQSKGARNEAMDMLAPEAYAARTYTETRERAPVPFFPVYSPINQYQVGVKKNFKYGVSADLSHSVDIRTGANNTNEFRDLTTITNQLAVNFDLWKDLFGKLTRARLDNADLMVKQAKLQSEIEKKNFIITLRRLYYNLLANEEKQLISKKLLDLANKQARDARKRKKNSIADAGEVARYESQVAARKGSLFYLEYERENIFKSLRQLIPTLQDYELAIGEYDIDQSINAILQCTSVISSQKVAPYKFTQYDEMKNLMNKSMAFQETIDKKHDDIDVKLTTAVRYIGVASEQDGATYRGSTSGAFDDINENNRMGADAGLMLNIPLGSKRADTAKVKELYNKKRYRAQIKNIDANLQSTHKQISKSIQILLQVIDAQQENSKKLNIRLKDMRKKYNQARVPVSALIQDQDALMSSDLSIIDTKLAIVNTILDYFVVFQETPCSFNRI